MNIKTNQIFSIRKSHIGVASVLLGTALAIGNTSVVEASTDDTTTPSTTATTQNQNGDPKTTVETPYKKDATITISKDYAEALLERSDYLSHAGPNPVVPSQNVESANDKKITDAANVLNTQKYENATNDTTKVDVNKLTEEQMLEVNFFTQDLVNDVRQQTSEHLTKEQLADSQAVRQNGTYNIYTDHYKNIKQVYLTKGMWDFAKEVSNEQQKLNAEYSKKATKTAQEYGNITLPYKEINSVAKKHKIAYTQYVVNGKPTGNPHESRQGIVENVILGDFTQADKDNMTMGTLKGLVYEGLKKQLFEVGNLSGGAVARKWEKAANVTGLNLNRRDEELFAATVAMVQKNSFAGDTPLYSLVLSTYYLERGMVGLPLNYTSNTSTVTEDGFNKGEFVGWYPIDAQKEKSFNERPFNTTRLENKTVERPAPKEETKKVYVFDNKGGYDVYDVTLVDGKETSNVKNEQESAKYKYSRIILPVANTVAPQYIADPTSDKEAGQEVRREAGKLGESGSEIKWELVNGVPEKRETPINTPPVPEKIYISTKPKEKKEEVPFQTVYEEDANLLEGTEKVKVKGVNGSKTTTTTYTLNTKTGEVTAKEETPSTVPATNKVVVKGTKKVVKQNGEPLENPRKSEIDITDPDFIKTLFVPKGNPILPGGKTPSTGKGGGQYVDDLPTIDPSLLFPEPPVQGPGNNGGDTGNNSGGDNGQVTPPSNNNGGNNGQVTPPSNNNGGNNGQVTPPSQGNYSGFNQPGKPLRNTGIVLPGVTGAQPANHKYNGRFEAPVSSKTSANALPKTSATTTNSASLPAGLAAALAAAGLLAANRRKED